MIMTIPDENYKGGLVIFGSQNCLGSGPIVEAHPVAPYDADAFNAAISRVSCASGRTPLADATVVALKMLPSQELPTSIIIISDGQDLGLAETKLAKTVKKKFGKMINIYTVQVGENPHGRKVLQGMAEATADGFYLNAVELPPASVMEEFVVEVLLYHDDDGEGVPNHLDKCADTPRGAVVDETGCAADADGDGVANNLDRCPDTPQGVQVDAAGCPVDSDGDGVPDFRDDCPGTAPRTVVDTRGCPVAGVEVVDGGLRISGVTTFAVGSAEISADGKRIFNEVARLLVENPQYVVEVQGHTDSTGSLDLNLRLSQQRAESVMAYLISRGVSAERLTAKGYGPNRPIADNATVEARTQNRRVEIVPTNND
jgi:OOP family OmpA-OmpF porin